MRCKKIVCFSYEHDFRIYI